MIVWSRFSLSVCLIFGVKGSRFGSKYVKDDIIPATYSLRIHGCCICKDIFFFNELNEHKYSPEKDQNANARLFSADTSPSQISDSTAGCSVKSARSILPTIMDDINLHSALVFRTPFVPGYLELNVVTLTADIAVQHSDREK